MPGVTFFLKFTLSSICVILHPHRLPHLDLGTPVFWTGIVVSLLPYRPFFRNPARCLPSSCSAASMPLSLWPCGHFAARPEWRCPTPPTRQSGGEGATSDRQAVGSLCCFCLVAERCHWGSSQSLLAAQGLCRLAVRAQLVSRTTVFHMPFLLLFISSHPPSQIHVFDVLDSGYLRGEPGWIRGAGDAEVNKIGKTSAFVRA